MRMNRPLCCGALLLTVLALGTTAGPAGARERSSLGYLQVKIASPGRLAILNARSLKLSLLAPRPLRAQILVSARVGTSSRSKALTRVRTVVFSRAGKRTVAIALTSSGFRALRSCSTVRMAVQTRARRLAGGGVKVRKTSITYPRVRLGCRGGLIVTGLGPGSGIGVGNHPGLGGTGTGAGYSVGVAARSINPTPAEIATGKVFLGGYGIASPPLDAGRPATGILGDGLHVRALAVSAGSRAAAFADIEVQGWFVANRDGPYGLVDMRKAVQARTGGALKATDVMIQSDHTHGGPDPMGVWGGVPVAYRQFMFNQTVDAIVEAYQRRRPGNLYYGTAPGRDLLSNQF
ncbi:MAG: Neutral/alkaline non-lysosomal ceramidase, N-terminal, partial [Solirubrobacteraceae bacterium]|nr:Neutral/alkaline non-lysosomal ceramidase, N-terminal [Solirubrobacteraceae bacterium]